MGTTLGAYRLVSIIGEGGMGSVWLAERCDGRFEGRAAIKLLNLALTGPAGMKRFRREGSILARLSHPHIARLADAGVSAEGQPYLVLEYVEGKPIDEYCDEHGLDVDARVRLMLDVLDAIAHAHANLIVHRDVKPPNVLVTADGQVKLLDFGIARLLEGGGNGGSNGVGSSSSGGGNAGGGDAGGLGDTSDLIQAGAAAAMTTAFTRHGGAMTPAYAAPEQLTGGPITTATDIYALGVLLYVLLTGHHPAGENSKTPVDLVRAIVDTDPARPSEVATPRIRRQLQGDLDVIVSKAMKKNPADRYESVAAFADDLRRSLQHEPIRARPDTLRYRAAMFLRRHRAGVASAATVALVIVGLTTFYATRLAAERDRARMQAEKAAKMSALLTGLFTGADPYAQRNTLGEPTVRGLLDAGAERLQKELAGQPDVQAEMMTVLGRVYERLLLYDKAQPLLQRALALGREASGPEHPRVAQSLNDLGVLLLAKGDYVSAAATLEEALAMRRRLLGNEHKDVAVTLVELARVHVDRVQYDRAEPLLREALAIRRKVLGEERRETATSMSDLGLLLWRRGDSAGAEPILRQTLEITRKVLAADHPDVGTAMSNVALIELDSGRYAEAETLIRQAIAIYAGSIGRRHTRVAGAEERLALALRGQGRLDEAKAVLDEALAIAREHRSEDHPQISMLKLTQARVHLDRGEAAIAEPLLREAMQAREKDWANDDMRLAVARSLLGGALTSLGRYDEAEPLLLRAHLVLKDARGRWAEDSSATASRLITLYNAMGRPDRAAQYRSLTGS